MQVDLSPKDIAVMKSFVSEKDMSVFINESVKKSHT